VKHGCIIALTREVLPAVYRFVARRGCPNTHYGGVKIAAKNKKT